MDWRNYPMKIIDLTHTLENNMTVYCKEETLAISKTALVQVDGYEGTLLKLYSHNGTHVDAPRHMIKGGMTLDRMDIGDFAGEALLLKVEAGEEIGMSQLEPYLEELQHCDFLIFNSGWYYRWNSEEYFSNYPILSEEAAIFLAEANLKGIGIDMISVDAYDSKDFKNHQLLLASGKVIFENLNNLDMAPRRFYLIAAPLKFRDSDGAPARVIAMCD